MLSLPNILTLSRILAVPILLFLLWPGVAEGSLQPKPIDYALAFGLYCLMGITDYFDGYVARSRGIVSRLGAFLDPIADKIMIAAVILLREIIVSGLREFLATLQVSMPVTQLAKWKTTFQLVAFGALILAGALPEMAWIKVVGLISLWGAAVLTLITGWDYLRVGLKHMD